MPKISPKIAIRKWKLLKSKIVFNHRWYKVRRDSVRTDRGKIIKDYLVGVFPAVVYIAVFTEEDKILFVRQYKHGAGKILFEVPAGYINKGEQPLQAAKRELLEETGYGAKSWKKLGVFISNPTKSRGGDIHIFIVKNARKIGKQNLDSSENIELHLFNKNEIIKKLARNEIKTTGSALTIILGLQEIKKLNR